MITKITMPKTDANLQEGTIGMWLRQPGEKVAAGEPLVEIITDKANFELESECDGILRMCIAPERSVVPVGYVIALVADSEDEPLPEVAAENEAIMRLHLKAMLFGAEAADETLAAQEASAQAPQQRQPPPGLRATPAARRLAKKHGVSLAEIAAVVKGPVHKSDVELFLSRRRCGAEEKTDA